MIQNTKMTRLCQDLKAPSSRRVVFFACSSFAPGSEAVVRLRPLFVDSPMLIRSKQDVLCSKSPDSKLSQRAKTVLKMNYFRREND